MLGAEAERRVRDGANAQAIKSLKWGLVSHRMAAVVAVIDNEKNRNGGIFLLLGEGGGWGLEANASAGSLAAFPG